MTIIDILNLDFTQQYKNMFVFKNSSHGLLFEYTPFYVTVRYEVSVFERNENFISRKYLDKDFNVIRCNF